MIQRLPLVIATLLLVLGFNLATTQANAATTVARTSSFVYDPASGLLIKEVIEPDNTDLCLVTEYTYDAFGNKASVTTRNCNGSPGEAAAPSALYNLSYFDSRTNSNIYDAKGQFVVKATNALGHIETRTFDARFGEVATLTGPNGLTTSWKYDTFGRKILETRADTTTSSWSYLPICTPLAAANVSSVIGYCVVSSQTGIAQSSFSYYDTLNRKILSSRRNMADTDWIDEGNTVYDNYGRVIKTYLPYERGQFPAAKYTSVSYDILGRPLSQIAANGSTSTMTYAGLTTSVSNDLKQTKTTVKNSQGQTVSVTDAQNKTISYLYDPFGNLTTTTDALGNVSTLTYDVRGRKIAMQDPDMGRWDYQYNAIGELRYRCDPRFYWFVVMTYDKLGRMVSRLEDGLSSYWGYDSPFGGIGKIAYERSDNGFWRSYIYDALGRLSSTSTAVENPAAPYVMGTTYDTAGRVLTQNYPASPGYPTGFAVTNKYNANGYLIQVVDAATSKVYWTADRMDAQGNLMQQTFGNGVITQQAFDLATGRVTQQQAGAGNAVQNMSYTYDKLGNLLSRVDANNNLTELYSYDSLNRVTSASAMSGPVNTTSAFVYDALGNISSKSDVGSYVYATPIMTPAVLNGSLSYVPTGKFSPHAVSSINGTVNGIVNPIFTYDVRGNLVAKGDASFTPDANGFWGNSGTGVTTIWTDFNMPAAIDYVSNSTYKSSAQFWYNPEHERVMETLYDADSNSGSTVITLSSRYDTGLHFEKKYSKDISAGIYGPVTVNPMYPTPPSAIEYEHYLYAGGLMFGKFTITTAADGVTPVSSTMEYYSKDHLGSIVAITNGAGVVTQRLSYDVWGKRRYPNGAADPNGLLKNPDMYHGFTGHEMLDGLGLIHMNGRLYDPAIARFVSADPLIQAPDNLQSYNRYSYVMNNPLSLTDPSGFCWAGCFWQPKTWPGPVRTIAAIAVAIYAPEISSYIGWTGAAGSMGMSSAVASGILGGAISGGIMGGTLQSAFVGGVTGGMFGAVGDAWPSGMENVLGHAGVGCASSMMSGGSCGSGAMSAGFGAAATPYISDWNVVGATMASAVIGGTASVLGGGKFENGAQTGAFGYLFNHWAHNLALAIDGIEAHQALQGYQSANGYATEASCISNGNCVNGRFDIASEDGRLWEIKRNGPFGEYLGNKAISNYTENTNFVPGGDLPGLPVGGSITITGSKGNVYRYENKGGGLIQYDKLPSGSGSTYQYLPKNYFSPGKPAALPILPLMVPVL